MTPKPQPAAARPGGAHAALGPPRARRRAPPRWARAALMAMLFAIFFLGSPIFALVLAAIRIFSRAKDARRRTTYLVHRGLRAIARTARFFRLVELDLTPLPDSIDPRAPYVLVSNHPTFIDMIVILGAFEGLTCVTNGRWWRHWAFGRLLRMTDHLPGPGSGLPQSEDMLGTMVAHLSSGHPLLVFPEGQRSLPRGLRRFRRGAVEAATAAGVPIVPLFLAVDRPYLTKQVSLWNPPARPPTYSFEWFDVVRPEAFGGDAKRIHEHLVALYRARYDEQLALQDRLAAEDARQAQKS
ncbi:MAG TPA: lysophospholipid acyltransferase family protein [Sandaracinaceae bacterium]